MTVRLAAVLAVILSAIGIGVVYVSTFIVNALLPLVPGFAAFLLWCSLTIVGIFLIVLGVLTFYATYMSSRSNGKGEE